MLNIKLTIETKRDAHPRLFNLTHVNDELWRHRNTYKQCCLYSDN